MESGVFTRSPRHTVGSIICIGEIIKVRYDEISCRRDHKGRIYLGIFGRDHTRRAVSGDVVVTQLQRFVANATEQHLGVRTLVSEMFKLYDYDSDFEVFEFKLYTYSRVSFEFFESFNYYTTIVSYVLFII